MMKRVLVLVAAVAVVSSSAMAISLSPLPFQGTGTSSEGRSLTNDGSALVGISNGKGVFYPLTRASGPNSQILVGSPVAIVAGGAWSFTTASGLATRTVSGQPQLVAQGLSAGYSSTAYSTDGGLTWLQGVRQALGSAPATGTSGTLKATGLDDVFYTSWFSDANGTNLYVEQQAGNPPALVSRDAKGTTQKSSIQGVSGTGLGVGRRRDASALYQNYKLQYGGAGGLAASFFNGLDGTTHGEAWAVSTDGAKIFGISPAIGKAGNWPYIYDVASGVTSPLPTVNTSSASSSNAWVYGCSADGRYAVGMDYTIANMEKAVLWDTVLGTEIDLTAWATNHGILGDFTGNLRRAYNVGVGSDGMVVVTGWGVNSALQTTGFVLAIPEPTTLAFLGLGGLVLVRRRVR